MHCWTACTASAATRKPSTRCPTSRRSRRWRLEMAELQEQVMAHLQPRLQAARRSAPAYLSAAVRLALGNVRAAPMRPAAAGLGEAAAGACEGLPLEAMVQLPELKA
jgi:hypothetical protein